MKTLLLCLCLTAVWGGEIFQHPNYEVSFPEPVITWKTELDLDALKRQNPQWNIFYTGGLVGMFKAEWLAPVWTTPWVAWYQTEEPERILPPIIPPVIECPTVPGYPPVVPPDCPSTEPPADPPGDSVPEPKTWVLVGCATLLIFACRGRK